MKFVIDKDLKRGMRTLLSHEIDTVDEKLALYESILDSTLIQGVENDIHIIGTDYLDPVTAATAALKNGVRVMQNIKPDIVGIEGTTKDGPYTEDVLVEIAQRISGIIIDPEKKLRVAKKLMQDHRNAGLVTYSKQNPNIVFCGVEEEYLATFSFYAGIGADELLKSGHKESAQTLAKINGKALALKAMLMMAKLIRGMRTYKRNRAAFPTGRNNIAGLSKLKRQLNAKWTIHNCG